MARNLRQCILPRSSSGLGRLPLTQVTRVQIPYGVPVLSRALGRPPTNGPLPSASLRANAFTRRHPRKPIWSLRELRSPMASAATVRRRRGTLRQMCLSPPLVPALYTSQSKRHIVPDAFPNHRKAALRKAADCSTVYSWKRCCGVWGRAVPVDCCPMVNGVSDNRLPGWMHRPVYRLAATMVSFGATFLPFVTVTGLMSGFTEFRTGSAVGGLFALVVGLLLIAGGWIKNRSA